MGSPARFAPWASGEARRRSLFMAMAMPESRETFAALARSFALHLR